MLKEISYQEYMNAPWRDQSIFVDMRSPSEFEAATIPGAINLPIFTDEERKIIGTLYDHHHIPEAKFEGIQAASRKLPEYYKIVENLYNEYSKVLLFCSRGGYRSSVFTSLLNALGIYVMRLKGGYKAYRAVVNENLPLLFSTLRLIVLTGNTGVGKTKILKELEKLNAPVIDLEGFAQHRGSLLGGIGLKKQNSQKMFEALIFEQIRHSEGKTFFIEGESKRIGSVIMPGYMYDAIRNGFQVQVTASHDFRIRNIREEYVNDNVEELISAMEPLIKFLGREKIENWQADIREGQYDKVIFGLIHDYYDKSYRSVPKIDWSIQNENPAETARLLLKTFIPEKAEKRE